MTEGRYENLLRSAARCRVPRPRSRRFEAMSSSSIRRLPFTLPTPGRDTTIAETLVPAMRSSVSARSRTSGKVRLPVLRNSLISARTRRALGCFGQGCSALLVGQLGWHVSVHIHRLYQLRARQSGRTSGLGNDEAREAAAATGSVAAVIGATDDQPGRSALESLLWCGDP